MGILSWIVLGLIAGLLANYLMPGKGPSTLLWTILLGIAGAFVGGFVATQLNIGGGDIHNISLVSIAVAVGGAVLLLFVYGLLKQKRMI